MVRSDERFICEPPEIQSEPSPLTFDDLEQWNEFVYKDREWILSSKGGDVTFEDGRHAEFWSLDEKQPQRLVIHEDWINNFLAKRTILRPRLQ